MTSKSAAAAARATVYGYPRQGPDRELKKAVEGYWKRRVGADALRDTARDLRRANWRRPQRQASTKCRPATSRTTTTSSTPA